MLTLEQLKNLLHKMEAEGRHYYAVAPNSLSPESLADVAVSIATTSFALSLTEGEKLAVMYAFMFGVRDAQVKG